MTQKKEDQESVQLNFFIPRAEHEKLRKISFEQRISISQICREGIELILKKYERKT